MQFAQFSNLFNKMFMLVHAPVSLHLNIKFCHLNGSHLSYARVKCSYRKCTAKSVTVLFIVQIYIKHFAVIISSIQVYHIRITVRLRFRKCIYGHNFQTIGILAINISSTTQRLFIICSDKLHKQMCCSSS